MLPEVDDPRDATYKHFAHTVGHECRHCAAIRATGPASFGNPLARLMSRAQGELTTDEEAERAVQRLPKKQQRKAARLAHKRRLTGVKGLLLAISTAA